MKNALLPTILITALCLCAQGGPTRADESGFQAFLRRWEAAQSRFLSGDPSWKQNSSQREDATIFGHFGGYEKGWKEVGPRYDWIASQDRPSLAKKQLEYLNVAVSGDLAFTVGIERDQVQVSGQSKPERALRVTQVFRKENGDWKLLHRHADPLVGTFSMPAEVRE
jgi:ketosteroid isomerase-like protein